MNKNPVNAVWQIPGFIFLEKLTIKMPENDKNSLIELEVIKDKFRFSLKTER